MCGPRSRPSQPGNSSGHWLETAGGHHALRVQRGDLHNYITNKPRRGRGTSNSWGVPRLKRGALPAAPDPQKSQMGARAPFFASGCASPHKSQKPRLSHPALKSSKSALFAGTLAYSPKRRVARRRRARVPIALWSRTALASRHHQTVHDFSGGRKLSRVQLRAATVLYPPRHLRPNPILTDNTAPGASKLKTKVLKSLKRGATRRTELKSSQKATAVSDCHNIPGR